MSDEEPYYPNQFKIIPKGKYTVVFDGRVLGVFNSQAEAIDFQSKLGRRGTQIVPPNLREKMTDDEIQITENIAQNWGEKSKFKPRPC